MSRLLDALQGKQVSPKPIWLMRQAGRYLPEYRDIREKYPQFLDLVYSPNNAAEVTLQPIKRFGFDAAILFSDILVIPNSLGLDVRFEKGEGPILKYSDDLLELISNCNNAPNVWQPVCDTVKTVRQALDPEKALIGFAGSPWTVFCYMVQGHGRTDFPKARTLIKKDPQYAQKIIDVIVSSTIDYLNDQINSGADVIQLFDSWAGLLSGNQEAVETFILEPTKKILDGLPKSTPTILFPKGLNQQELLQYSQALKPDGLSISYDIDPYWAADTIPENITIQGNLDPETLLKGGDRMVKEARTIMDAFKNRPSIFNLGHGINKETPMIHVYDLVGCVRGTL